MPQRRRSATFRVLVVDPDDATGVQLNADLDGEVFELMCVNTDTAAYADLGHIYRAERMKPGRNPWLPEFVDGLLAE